MADDGLLSQEEVDALTSGLTGNGDSLAASFHRASIAQAADNFLEEGRKVLSANLGDSLKITESGVAFADKEKLAAEFPESLSIESGFDKGFEGRLHFLIGKKTASRLGALMLGAEGEPEYSEEHRDAVTELCNQWMGSLSAALGKSYDVPLSASQCETREFNPDKGDFPSKGSVAIEYKLTIKGVDAGIVSLVLSQPLVISFTDPTSASAAPSVVEDKGFPSAFPDAPEPENAWMDSAVAKMGSSDKNSPNIQMLMDIGLNVTIELGRTNLSIRRILELGPGSIVEMDRLAGEPVDLLVNDKVVAKGEVVVVDEYFGIRIISLVSPEERIRQLQ